MSRLLDKLRQSQVKLPEVEFYIPELGETVLLRGLTVMEGRERGKRIQDAGEDEPALWRARMEAISYIIVDSETGERPFANKDGVDLLLSRISEITIIQINRAYDKLVSKNLDELEGNLEPGAAPNGSSSVSPSPSAKQSTSSKGTSARPN